MGTENLSYDLVMSSSQYQIGIFTDDIDSTKVVAPSYMPSAGGSFEDTGVDPPLGYNLPTGIDKAD